MADLMGIVRLFPVLMISLAVLAGSGCSEPEGTPLAVSEPLPTNGPLRVSPTNPRYFADGDGRIVYLRGSHTWTNFQDSGPAYPPEAFDFEDYIDRIAAHGHNFFRLWSWEQSNWTPIVEGDYWFEPLPFQRNGPGTALDGRPRFDLGRFNPAYFDRLRERVERAGSRGFYVAIMLFDGWSVGTKGSWTLGNPWNGHPFNGSNNINGIDGDVDGDGMGYEIHTLSVPETLEVQQAYLEKVIDAVGDLDNVLYEVSNESAGGSMAWQEAIAQHVRSYEARSGVGPHPVGITALWPGGENADLMASSADWISPNGDMDDPPAADGSKVVIDDTDHLCGICGDPVWVWRSFLRGRNPVFMDPWDGQGVGVGAGITDRDLSEPRWIGIRENLGYTAAYAARLDLAAMVPHGNLASSGYALAAPEGERGAYVVLAPEGRPITVDLTPSSGAYAAEWFSPLRGTTVPGDTVQAGGERRFRPPFDGASVLYLEPVGSPLQAARADSGRSR
jgi:hypothetical protein